MKLIKKYNDVNFLGLIDNQMVLRYKDHVELGKEFIHAEKDDDFIIWNNSSYLSLTRNKKEYVYIDNKFRPWPHGRYGDVSPENLRDSAILENGRYKLSFFLEGTEHLFDIESNIHYCYDSICKNKSKDVIMLSVGFLKNPLLFYSKTGEFLWQYTEEDADLKINRKCIPVVDDVVVIISQDCGVMGKVQGFNIRTGEKLWELDRRDRICSNTFFVGEDKMLYGCIVLYFGGIAELNLCEINPFTGKLERTVVLKDNDLDVCSWNVTMHGRRLYYADNREGKEIGVIDVDRKEIVERQPLEIKKNVTIGAPIVTDDRMYVYIRELNELRVYEL